MTHNIYYNPEKYALTIVAELDFSSGAYEYDTRVVWKTADGRLLTHRESGCSCPTPFEDLGVNDLSPVDIKELRAECQSELAEDYPIYIKPEEAQEFLEKVRQASKKKEKK